jgi:hypothetical protein
LSRWWWWWWWWWEIAFFVVWDAVLIAVVVCWDEMVEVVFRRLDFGGNRIAFGLR